MAYSHFKDLAEIKKTFGLQIERKKNLCQSMAPVSPSDILQAVLKSSVELALAINTEKARSEFIIAPILLEVRKILEEKISLFSGIEFNVDEQKGLNGVCDFLISRSPEQLFVNAPVVVIVESKKDDLQEGIPQCLAAMLAAWIFNQRENDPLPKVYGAVTTGNLWQFLQLQEQSVFIDAREYYIEDLEKILGILVSMARPSM